MHADGPARFDSLRDALLDQLAYLADEAEALRAVIRLVPPVVLETQPVPGELSVKELYALLLRRDEVVNTPFVRQLLDGRTPEVSDPPTEVLLEGTDWNASPIDRILTRLTSVRRDLVAACRQADDDSWRRSGISDTGTTELYTYLYNVVQQDVDVLRTLGERLHAARLSDRSTRLAQ